MKKILFLITLFGANLLVADIGFLPYFLQEDKLYVVLGLQNRVTQPGYFFDKKENVYAEFGGKVKEGETAEQAIINRVKAELGLDIQPAQINQDYVLHDSLQQSGYVATDKKPYEIKFVDITGMYPFSLPAKSAIKSLIIVDLTTLLHRLTKSSPEPVAEIAKKYAILIHFLNFLILNKVTVEKFLSAYEPLEGRGPKLKLLEEQEQEQGRKLQEEQERKLMEERELLEKQKGWLGVRGMTLMSPYEGKQFLREATELVTKEQELKKREEQAVQLRETKERGLKLRAKKEEREIKLRKERELELAQKEDQARKLREEQEEQERKLRAERQHKQEELLEKPQEERTLRDQAERYQLVEEEWDKLVFEEVLRKQKQERALRKYESKLIEQQRQLQEEYESKLREEQHKRPEEEQIQKWRQLQEEKLHKEEEESIDEWQMNWNWQPQEELPEMSQEEQYKQELQKKIMACLQA